MKKYLARILFWPVTWLFIEILEELQDEVIPKSYAKNLRTGKWIITGKQKLFVGSNKNDNNKS